MALKSSREGLRKELVDYLGNIIIDDNLRNEIIKVVGDKFVTSESLNEAVNNLTMQITTENSERIEADDTLQNNITTEATARGEADTTLQNNINAEITARQEAISNLQGLIETSNLQVDLLWTNASSTSNFGEQTISLDLTNYNYLLISTRGNIEFNNKFDNFISKNATTIFSPYDVQNYGLLISCRFIEISNSGIHFYKGSTFNKDGSSYRVSEITCIPINIYGIKQ